MTVYRFSFDDLWAAPPVYHTCFRLWPRMEESIASWRESSTCWIGWSQKNGTWWRRWSVLATRNPKRQVANNAQRDEAQQAISILQYMYSLFWVQLLRVQTVSGLTHFSIIWKSFLYLVSNFWVTFAPVSLLRHVKGVMVTWQNGGLPPLVPPSYARIWIFHSKHQGHLFPVA